MKNKAAFNIFLTLLLIFSLFPVFPPSMAAAPVLLDPIDGRNTVDLEFGVPQNLDYGYINGRPGEISETAFKFGGIDTSKTVDSAYFTFTGSEAEWNVTNFKIALADDNWPINQLPASVTPEQSSYSASPHVSSRSNYNSADQTYTYRFNVTSLLTPSGNITGAGSVSFLLSTNSPQDAYILYPELEIEYAAAPVNTAPVLTAIGNKTVNEGNLLTFTASASDAESNPLTYSLVGAPTGASINASTGEFIWTPSEAQGPNSYTFTVRVSDGTLTDEESITVTVNEVNTAPVLAAIGNKTVDEESLLTFTASAADADIPANTLTYSLVGAPTGANINASTGVFTWTPTEAQGPGSYTFTVRVSDGTLTDEESITVTVNEVNAAPVLAAIGNKTVNEESLLAFTATATDSDSAILTYSLEDEPTGASINAATGEFTWTPTEAQGPGNYTFEVVVSDGVLSDREEITVTVNEVNTAPVLSAIGDKTVNEGNPLTFTANASDADVPANALTYSLVGAPTGASINVSTGVFTWTPTEAQGPDSYTFTVRVSDGAATDEESITVTVNEVNVAPVLAAIGNKTVDEESLLTFTAVATDADLPANTLTYSLVDAPTGASIDESTGEFTWTPTEAQGPGTYPFTVQVSDGTLTDEESITVTVNEVNAAPVLAPIGNKTVNEESPLTFTAAATDSDSATLTYSLAGAPTGASIDASTGEFTWTPTEAQGPDSHTFEVVVSDGVLSDSEEITVTVNEVNVAPVLAVIGDQTLDEGSLLSFTASATDVDLPANTLTYSLVGEPIGASINSATGEFIWTPTEAQGPGSFTFIVRVSDGVQNDSEEITVTVNEVNVAPVLAAIGNQTVDEESLLTFTASATDIDLPVNTLVYSLVGAPTGASINASTGVFTWTPTEAQGPGSYTFEVVVSDGVLSDSEEITVTVNEVNAAPVLAAIGDKTVDEESPLTFTATATDSDSATLTYSLAGAPTGASIDASTGEFTWTPTEAQGPDSHTFEVVVSDGVLSDSEEITVTVNEVNVAPVLTAIGDQMLDEGSLLSFTASATDVDLPANTLTYSLVGEPTGASINSTTGEFTWTPTEAQGPDSYTFTVRVSDGTLTDEESITVTVNEVNTAPVLAAIGNKTIDEESLLTFTASATDTDLPANTLTYILVGAPTGASIDESTGEFTWTPTEAQGPGIYPFTVRVSDGTLTDEESITVTVNEVNAAPVLAAIGDKEVNEESPLTFTATATDPDSATLTYSLAGAPTGASINAATGEFTWTPTEAQGPDSYTFEVVVSDGVLSDSEEITVTVNEVNVAPVLAAIGDQMLDEGSLLSFTASATDVDLPANTLTYSLVGAPTGASLNSTTGEFTWTPTEAQGPGSFTFIVRVSDGVQNDSEEITVTVNEVNTAPVLAAIGNKTVDEESLLTFTAVATDTDLPANTLAYSLVGAPTGASIDESTGEFIWTPTEAQGPGIYPFTVRVSDGTLTDEESITVTVNEVNAAPVLAAIGDKTVNEESPLTFTAAATDPDSAMLTYSLADAPSGASINAATGEFTWTPTEAQGPDSYTFEVVVSDGALSDREEITVTVNEVNTAPVLAAIGNQTVNEGSLLSFTAAATDVDLPANTLTYSLVGAPTGASIDSATGEFIWTPTEAQGPDSYTFTVRVSDGALTDEESIEVTVNEVNAAPVLAAIGNKTIDEESLLTFTASATDADLPANILTYSLVGAPIGASIDESTGEFTWTPTEAQGPGSYPFTVRVSDGALTDEENITVTVNEVNTAPVLAAIGDKTVNEGSSLTFTATATDVDQPVNTLTYSLADEPSGASINAATGEFAWTPTEAQGPNSYTFEVVVSDGTLSDSEEITVTVNEVNVAPVLAAIGDKTVNEESLLTFIAAATDADLPANTLTFSLEDAPQGAAIDAASGEFAWTPTEAQGPNSYTFTVRVSDGALSSTEEITVTVNEVAAAPVLDVIGNQTVDEESELSFTVTAIDTDLPADTLTYSLEDAPTGASINATTGVFTWTPTEAQGPGNYTLTVRVSDGALTDEETITITVNEVNAAPVLAAIGDKTVDEGSQLAFTATATDGDVPANTLTYSLVDAPQGAGIDEATGEFTWTPTEAQGPNSYTFEVVVSDGTLSDSEEITVTVNEVNTAPVLAVIGNQTVDEGSELSFTASATDADLPANTLTYSLVGAPTGASIHATSGVFTWTPAETQGPNSYTFTVRVSDGVLTDEETITVTVNEANTAPVLQTIGDKSVTQGSQLTFTATATDEDEPANTLTYSLIDAPEGAEIDSATGEFAWRPSTAQASRTFTFTVQVSDGALTDEEVITIIVNAAYSNNNNTAPGVNVLVNGKVEHAGVATITVANGQKVMTVAVDEQKLMQRLEQEGKKSVITIPVQTDSDVIIGEINGHMIQSMENQQSTIVLQTNNASYSLPAEQINIAAASRQLGTNLPLEDVVLKIEISEPLKETLQIVEEAVNRAGLTQVAPPVNFKVSVVYDGHEVEILRFNSYVERAIAIPEGTDPNKITTGIVVERDGAIRHVPTQITEIGDTYYAIINSLTNSTYSVVWNPLQFVDLENHWAKAAVNNMGSRMVVNGTGSGMYNPDQDITRAEFAAIIVRGLGLRLTQGESVFTDVHATDWYQSAIQTASEYGLINGFEDGTFRPNDKITREQAMLIVSKAMVLTGLKDSLTNQSALEAIGAFSDADTVSKWALNGVADSINAGIVSGRNKKLLAPKANITRAEVAMIIQRLLQKSDLINK